MTDLLQEIQWGKPAAGLRLGLVAVSGLLKLYLQNVGSDSLQVLSHVQAGEAHLDWYRVVLQGTNGELRGLEFWGERNKSAVVQIWLEEGALLQHEVDLKSWAERPVNGAKPLLKGRYEAKAVYEVENDGPGWRGRLEAGPVSIEIA